VLKQFVNAMQDLEDNKLDELFLSCPPRIGKTTLVMMFILWIMGRDSERSNLYCSYSDTITAAFYNGVSEILTDNVTYHFKDVFPLVDLKNQNAKEEYLDLGRKKRYHSLTARSLYGTLNGACDASGVIIADDLISGIEEALNKDRLRSAWDKVNNNLLTRGKGGTKLLWIGTRWSIVDPIGVRRDMLENDPKFANVRYKIIDIPALNENDESNFDYDYGVGFSTEFYHMRRASFERQDDVASWDAGYMQKPVERTGSLFEPDSLRYYNGELPPEPPDAVWSVTDPSYGGGDYVAKPILYIYGSDIFVHDVVFSNLDKKNTIPMCVQKIIQHHVTREQVEGTKSTESYADDLSRALKEAGYSLAVTSKPASTKQCKQDRITNRAPDIRDNFIFRSSGNRSKEYQSFMEQVFAFKIIGKNVHDDAPDSLAMAADMIFKPSQQVEIFRRLF
jgi:predicted phage terminase large subunit-like protein